MNTFKFVGKIKKLEEKNDRRYIETVSFDSGWMMERAKFLVVNGGNEQFVDVSGGKYRDNTKNTVYTLFETKKEDESTEYESVEIDWNKRFDQEVIEKVPRYKKYVIDLASDRIREDLIANGKEGEAAALAEQKYVYITPYDFTLKIGELLKENVFGNENYVVSGTVEYSYSYSKKTNQWGYYRSFVPNYIRKASSDEKPGMYGKLDFYYLQEDYMGPLSEDNVRTINGYLQFYERMSKKNYFVPSGVQIKPENDMFTQVFDMNYFDDAEVLVVGVSVEFYRGTVKTEIKEVELSEKNQLLIKLGARTKEDIIAELSGVAYGDTVERVYMTGISRGYAEGPKSANVTASALVEQPSGGRETLSSKVNKNGTKNINRSKIVDLFSDDEESEDEI